MDRIRARKSRRAKITKECKRFTKGCNMTLNLTHRELKEILEIVETINPPDTMMLMAGRVTITVDNSSGIGSIVKVTVPVKQGDRWGEWTTNITDESSW